MVDDAGHKHNLSSLAAGAQLASEGHTVQPGHLDVEKHDVARRVIKREEQLPSRRKGHDLSLDATPSSPVTRERAIKLPGRLLVIDNRNAQHVLLPSLPGLRKGDVFFRSEFLGLVFGFARSSAERASLTCPKNSERKNTSPFYT